MQLYVSIPAMHTRNPDKPYDLPYDGESTPRHDLTTRVMNNRGKSREGSLFCMIQAVVFRLGPPTLRDIVALPGDNRLPGAFSAQRYLCGMHRSRAIIVGNSRAHESHVCISMTPSGRDK